MLALDSLTAGYGGAAVLRGLSARFGDGALIGIVGPNGSGKSTLIKAAAGLIAPDSGTVTVNGAPLPRARRDAAQLVGYLPQERGAPAIPVERLVEHGRYAHLPFGRALSAQDHDCVWAAMTEAGILDLADRRVDRLSGGERQKAYFAMLLAQRAPVMLLDEPTAHLDPRARFQALGCLAACARRGLTVAVALHDLTLALRTCDELLVLENGRAIAQATPDDLIRSGVLSDVFQVSVEKIGPARYVVEPGTFE